MDFILQFPACLWTPRWISSLVPVFMADVTSPEILTRDGFVPEVLMTDVACPELLVNGGLSPEVLMRDDFSIATDATSTVETLCGDCASCHWKIPTPRTGLARPCLVLSPNRAGIIYDLRTDDTQYTCHNDLRGRPERLWF